MYGRDREVLDYTQRLGHCAGHGHTGQTDDESVGKATLLPGLVDKGQDVWAGLTRGDACLGQEDGTWLDVNLLNRERCLNVAVSSGVLSQNYENTLIYQFQTHYLVTISTAVCR